MRLIHVVPSLAEQHGGPSRSVRALCRALAGEGHDVELLATDPGAPAAGEASQDGPLRVRIFRRDWPERLCPSRGLARALRSVPADLVHHHSLWLRTLHYAHRATTRLVISPRGMMSAWAWRHRPWRKRFARAFVHRGALPAARGWHATSEEESAEIRQLGFTAPVCVAPNGVTAPGPDDAARAREHWFGLCPETSRRPVALFYSRLHRKKRVLELIDLWLARGPADWLLLIAGIPEDYQPDLLERYVQRNSGAGRIRVFASLGQPPPYAIASLFLLPSHSENFGLVVAEAMAHGVPALVTDTTPWREMARRGLGWCVPWPDFGPALDQVIAEGAGALRERGAQARAWAVREFAWEHSARRLAAFYQQLLPPSP